MIDKATVARIMDVARIEEVVADYIPLRKRGVNLIGLCPFHNEKTGSFTVSPTRGIFKCFGCGEAGNVISFVRKIEDVDFYKAVEILAQNAGMKMPEYEDIGWIRIERLPVSPLRIDDYDLLSDSYDK